VSEGMLKDDTRNKIVFAEDPEELLDALER
jgi:hypothetical protein